MTDKDKLQILLVGLFKILQGGHRECADDFYSCPKSDNFLLECNCHIEDIEKLLEKIGHLFKTS